MANPLDVGGYFKNIWHTMTSYDRHSNFDSPYRTGRHVPLGQGGLTSVATASESRADITSPYADYNNRSSLMNVDANAYNGAPISPAFPPSPGGGRPYSPGLRGQLARSNTGDGFETQSSGGEIPMQSFQDGMPPPPPVTHSWNRIDTWAEENYPELFDQLCEGCTVNDLNELEHMLDCTLPPDVRDSLQVHDGQERGGMPTGIVFTAMLLDCEEMVQDWDQWRKVNQHFLLDTAVVKPAAPSKALGGSSEASSSKSAPAPNTPNNAAWRETLVARQESVPAESIAKAYAHPAWIPLVRDWGGNNLAVDLAPGPKGYWGQIILFGRDYDTKYVVARSWGHFLATLADDLNSGKWFIDEDSHELKLREFKSTRVEPSYFDILRWRMDQKHGRGAQAAAQAAKRKSATPRPNSTASAPSSPYSPPAEPNGEVRGRSLNRLSGSSPLASPMRAGYGKASPLARVTEEASLQELTVPNGTAKPEKLVEVETPRVSGEENTAPRLAALTKGETSDSTDSESPSAKASGKKPMVMDEAMKEIEI